jgi:hypothetical protein
VTEKTNGESVMSKCVRHQTAKASAGWIAAATAALVLVPNDAGAYSKKVENACRSDYDAHCPGYKVGSGALRSCITLAGKRGNLSKRCFDALVDAGMVPRKYLKKK